MEYEWTEERMAYWKKTRELYGITPRQLNRVRHLLIVNSQFLCGVCGRDCSGKRMYLDHDHHSGAIRGVTCLECNRFRVAKNTTDTALEVVRYLANPPAQLGLDALIAKVKAEG